MITSRSSIPAEAAGEDFAWVDFSLKNFSLLTCFNRHLANVNFGIILDDFVNMVNLDFPADRVLDAHDPAFDFCIDVLTVFKSQVSPPGPAVFHRQPVDIAQALVAFNRAVNQGNILSIPGEIFPTDLRVVDGHVLAVPKGILRNQTGIVDFHILRPVEAVVANQIQMVNVDVFAIHPEVVAIHRQISQADIFTSPQGFLSVGKMHVIQGHPAAAAELLRCLNAAVSDGDIIGIPDP